LFAGAAPGGRALLESLPPWYEPAAEPGVYLSRGAAGAVRLDPRGAELSFAASNRTFVRAFSLRFSGAKPLQWRGEAPRGGVSRYMTGADRARWRNGVQHYARVRAEQVWPGIDVVSHADGKLLEYDFVVAPGADPGRIGLRIEARRGLSLTPEGDLVVRAGDLEVRQHRPVAYQQSGGRRTPVEASYRLKGKEVGFQLGAYDRSRPLVIDPVITYSGFLGGASIEEIAGVAPAADGGFWVTGTAASEMPIPEGTGPFQDTRRGSSDVFLARIVAGEGGAPRLAYWTYIGSPGEDTAAAMFIDRNGLIYITGSTNSTHGFPIAGNVPQVDSEGGWDGFVLRYDPTVWWDLALTFSTYFGTDRDDHPQAVAVSGDGLIAIAAFTSAGTLPAARQAPLQPSNRGGVDCLIATFDPSLDTPEVLRMATFLGGDSSDVPNAAFFDADGKLWLAGVTMSEDFPLAGASYLFEQQARGDVFLARLDPRKESFEVLEYATYIGGTRIDVATAMAPGPGGTIWLAGYTQSDDLIVTPGAHQLGLAGGTDGFLMLVDPAQSGAGFLRYATYLGGSGTDIPYALALHGNGAVTLAGYTTSRDLPVTGLAEPATGGFPLPAAWIATLDPARRGAEALVLSQIFGGSGTDVFTSIALDAAGNLFAGGYTNSHDVQVTPGASKPNGLGLLTGLFLHITP
jgi:hypothetical protein